MMKNTKRFSTVRWIIRIHILVYAFLAAIWAMSYFREAAIDPEKIGISIGSESHAGATAEVQDGKSAKPARKAYLIDSKQEKPEKKVP